MADKLILCNRGLLPRLTRATRLTHISHIHSPAKTRLSSTSTPPSTPKLRRRNILIFALLGAATATYFLLPTIQPSHPAALNDTTFTPYTIIQRTALSPSSFVLTVVPQQPGPTPYFLPGTNRWRHPLWSVEFKQPEVQISRHYTPLPPLISESDEAQEKDGALRFYIRAVGDGEMSRYLLRLREAQTVHLRGPHVGFDLVHRLGARKLLVFLAGGTGVVPGMQAARVALDGYEDTKVSLLWAVRTRAEVMSSEVGDERAWWDVRARQPGELTGGAGLSPVAEQLMEMKKTYGSRFSVQVAVDEEHTTFQKPHVQQALASISSEDGGSTKHPGTGCALHDQKLHEHVSQFETEKPTCACKPMEGALPGKNIFIVSGPDGFVRHYAGEKIWRGGMQTQGAVGGAAGELQRRDARLKNEWLVLKL